MDEPRTELESVVAGVWADVLGIGGVGLRDNFFTLGGHSLQMLEVADRLSEELGMEVELTAMLDYPTVAAFAAAMAARSRGGGSA
jgi:acyl carrier protein